MSLDTISTIRFFHSSASSSARSTCCITSSRSRISANSFGENITSGGPYINGQFSSIISSNIRCASSIGLRAFKSSLLSVLEQLTSEIYELNASTIWQTQSNSFVVSLLSFISCFIGVCCHLFYLFHLLHVQWSMMGGEDRFVVGDGVQPDVGCDVDSGVAEVGAREICIFHLAAFYLGVA